MRKIEKKIVRFVHKYKIKNQPERKEHEKDVINTTKPLKNDKKFIWFYKNNLQLSQNLLPHVASYRSEVEI